MNKQEASLKLLEKTLGRLEEFCNKFEKREIKFVTLNGKKYKKINFSTYQIEDGLNHFATESERNNNIIIKANTLTKPPYRCLIDETKKSFIAKKIENISNTDVEYVDLKYRYDTLLMAYAKQKNEIALYNKLLKNTEAIESQKSSGVQLVLSENLTDEILSNLLVLMSEDFLITINQTKGDSSPEIYYEYLNVNQKICNYRDLKNLNIELNENKKIIHRNIINIKVK